MPLQLAEEQAQSTWALGNSYEAAAIQLIHENRPKIFIPTLVLFLHALELYLKAFFSFNIALILICAVLAMILFFACENVASMAFQNM